MGVGRAKGGWKGNRCTLSVSPSLSRARFNTAGTAGPGGGDPEAGLANDGRNKRIQKCRAKRLIMPLKENCRVKISLLRFGRGTS